MIRLKDEIRSRQNDLTKDVQTVKSLLEKFTEEDYNKIKLEIKSLKQKIKFQNLRIEVFQSCNSNPMGILHPRLGLSEFSLSWYDVFRIQLGEMKDFDNFIRKERTLTGCYQL